jgi:hypothetical protein
MRIKRTNPARKEVSACKENKGPAQVVKHREVEAKCFHLLVV